MTITYNPDLLALTQGVDEDTVVEKTETILGDLNRAHKHLTALKTELYDLVDTTYGNSDGFNIGATEEHKAGFAASSNGNMDSVDYTQPPSYFFERAYALQTFDAQGLPQANRFQHYIDSGTRFAHYCEDPQKHPTDQQRLLNDTGQLITSINTALSSLNRMSAQLSKKNPEPEPDELVMLFQTLPDIIAVTNDQLQTTRPNVLSRLESQLFLSQISTNPSYATAYQSDETFRTSLTALLQDPDNHILLQALATGQDPRHDPEAKPRPGQNTFVNIIKNNRDTFAHLSQVQKRQLSDRSPTQQRNFFHLARNARTREGVSFLAEQMLAEGSVPDNRYSIEFRTSRYNTMNQEIGRANRNHRQELRNLAELVDMTRMLSEFDNSGMIEQLSSDKRFQEIVRVVEIESAKIDRYLGGVDKNKQGVFRGLMKEYRTAQYQLASNQLAHRPSSAEAVEKMDAAQDRVMEAVGEDRHPFLRTCLQRISNALGKLLFGLVQPRHRTSDGTPSFWAKPESAIKMDVMREKVRTLLDNAQRSDNQNQEAKPEPDSSPGPGQ